MWLRRRSASPWPRGCQMMIDQRPDQAERDDEDGGRGYTQRQASPASTTVPETSDRRIEPNVTAVMPVKCMLQIASVKMTAPTE